MLRMYIYLDENGMRSWHEPVIIQKMYGRMTGGLELLLPGKYHAEQNTCCFCHVIFVKMEAVSGPAFFPSHRGVLTVLVKLPGLCCWSDHHYGV